MIKLMENFWLDADEYQYMLHEWNGKVSVDKRGKERRAIKRTWFCSSIDGVLNALAEQLKRRKIAGATGQQTVNDLKRWLVEVNTQLAKIIQGLDGCVEVD